MDFEHRSDDNRIPLHNKAHYSWSTRQIFYQVLNAITVLYTLFQTLYVSSNKLMSSCQKEIVEFKAHIFFIDNVDHSIITQLLAVYLKLGIHIIP